MLLIALAAGCGGGGSSPVATPTTPTPPAPTTANLSGRVTESVGTSTFPIAGATITVVDGANAGRAASTNSTGDYQLTGLQRGGFTVTVAASGYQAQSVGVDLTGDVSRNFSLNPAGPRTRFAAGTHRVGSDIAAGRYYSDPTTSGCYWERLRGFGGTLGDIIANDFVGYNPLQYIVDVLTSDLAFAPDSDCGIWFKDSPRQSAQSGIPPGVWVVGSQIAPGTYQINSGAGCYWERLRDFQHVLNSIIANDFNGSATTQFVTIQATDVGFLNDGDCGSWARTSAVVARQVSDSQTPSMIEQNRTAYQQKARGRR